MIVRKSGFSLFEVLIAFAIMSLVLVALLPGQARLLTRATESSQNALALEYALSKAAELGVTRPLRIGSLSEPYRDWSISQNTRALEQADGGQIVETEIIVTSSVGRTIARVTSLGLLSDDN